MHTRNIKLSIRPTTKECKNKVRIDNNHLWLIPVQPRASSNYMKTEWGNPAISGRNDARPDIRWHHHSLSGKCGFAVLHTQSASAWQKYILAIWPSCLPLTPQSTRIFAALHARHFKRTTISVKELHVQKLHMFRIVIETGSKISHRKWGEKWIG